MTTQLLATELANLIQESKRKHNDLRQAAEKALEELKGIRAANEAQAAAELAQRPNFVNPFIIACGTRNAKFTSIAIVCLQRLIVACALPRGKLNQVLEALREATSSGLDVQLKILQALPSLLQNYAHDVRGDLLITSLNICFILQTSKNAIVNNTSAATLQQLVVSVFDKVVSEDRSVAGEVPVGENTLQLGTAALDAYRVFHDLCLLTENRRPEYLRFAGLPQTFGLELIESVLTNHAAVFLTHPEQAYILRSRVMPFLTRALKDKPNFATTVRLLLDHDTTLWKRSLCMEVFRGIFAEHALLRRIFMLYDAKEGEKDILKTLTATFVRLSTEKPAVIGLGHQSTLPVSNPYGNPNAATDHAMIEAGGVTGIIGTSAGTEGSTTGISAQWSTMRVPCIDQLDKTEPPTIPESYIYSLILSCISSLSEGIAKFILPLTVPAETRSRKRAAKQAADRNSPAPTPEGSPRPLGPKTRLERSGSGSFKRNPVPRNPLKLEDHPLFAEIKTCASIVEECWPAFLATCSTFLYAALDSEYYHGLVRAFQKFAHVAGLLQLATPRDAFLTTLGKAAVPPNVFTACLNTGPPRTPSVDASASATTPGSLFSNAKGLLSVESLVNPASSAADGSRQPSFEVGAAALTTRNLLCLRALLNLGIALGPTLGPSWRIILETLQQADFVLYSTSKTAGRTPTVTRGQDPQAESEADALLANFGSETRAVETAASRLIESTVDFPNEAFVQVVEATCDLLDRRHDDKLKAEEKAKAKANANRPQSPPSGGSAGASLKAPSPGPHRRLMNVSTTAAAGPNQEDQFALAKLGDVATINVERLLAYPPEVSGWATLVSELIRTLGSSLMNASVRLRAADILVKLVLEFVNVATSLEAEQRGTVQLQASEALRDALVPLLRREDREATVATQTTDVDVHKAILEGLTTLLENCGESLVSGWQITFEIIDSIFKGGEGVPGREDSKGGGLATRSPKLVRSSFNSLRLICSDFLASLPNSCFLILVDTLYKFCSQDDDLNMALTTVTFFWVLSDFLSGKNTSMRITSQMMDGSDALALAKRASKGEDDEASNAALWMLLLLRLTSVTTDRRLELRNSAVQTLLRIFDAYGDNLDTEAWHTCVKHVIFSLLSSMEDELEALTGDETDDEERKAWYGTSVLVLGGISGLLASYLEVLAKHPSFNSLWQELLGHFTTLLDFNVLDINTATFKALGNILNQSQRDEKCAVVFDNGTVTAVWRLWSRGIPGGQDGGSRRRRRPENADNQDCLVAYVGAFHDVYRLVEADLTVAHVDRMLALFRGTLQRATVAGAYVSDVEKATPLQNQVMEAIKAIRTDLAGVPAVIISQVAELIRLPFQGDTAAQAEQGSTPSSKRTFVAMSKASMEILRDLVLQKSADPDIYSSGAVASALSALAQPITSKYGFAVVVTRSAQPWRLATEVTLAVLEAVLPKLHTLHGIPRNTVQEIWETVVRIADGIVSADMASSASSAAANIADDESFDISSFQTLRKLITPALGAEVIPDRTRKSYAESLFRTCIIHAPPPSEQATLIYGNNSDGGAGLAALYKSRPGRTVDPLPTRRAKMSYVCLDELFALIALQDEEADGTCSEDPGDDMKQALALRVRMARVAAPLVILRAGLTLRGFIADQPLRGRMPQPLSQRRELLHVLRALVDLRSRPEAIPDAPNVDCESRKHLLRLYPLLVQTVRVAGAAGDEGVLAVGTEALGVVGCELGV
ncbi:hypothetical protein SODALDRAFT_270010 [Sodiomyces alkalinus F11]|uniref:Endosomal peripheral membrane protein n=1 Tax=Sodiomyces alkalinus (strain CBS 110278 / VKM F-3762 / F11) TaxID=1314773 RepID=A0A3N2QAR9_SODAK|nr:hypothetical protein SODALDRAFT_270010 [Sodiomyces alkalinus F11]ROT43768.1 hypothetical protein SODALDRAFT_270010 [Sodiomyces alkalinus F11]